MNFDDEDPILKDLYENDKMGGMMLMYDVPKPNSTAQPDSLQSETAFHESS
jgi:hypothetical protein